MQQVFYGFKKPEKKVSRNISIVRKNIIVPGKKELRPYQLEANDITVDYLEKNPKKRPITVMATGCGKTFTFSKLIERLEKRTLVLAHRKELLTQGRDAIVQSCNLSERDVDVVLRSDPDPDARVWVASVQTLFAGGGYRLDKIDPELIVVDECHHATENSKWYSNVILDRFSDVPCVGYTATATRRTKKERLAFSLFWDDITYQYNLKRAILDRYLADLRYYQVKSDVDIKKVKTTAGDFNKNELSQTVNVFRRNNAIFDKWKEVGGGKTVVFCVDVDHAKSVLQVFKDKGVESYIVTGKTKDRDKILEHFDKAKMKQDIVIVNIDVLTEGWDCDNLRVIILARPTKSQIVYLQQLGRVTRRSKREGEEEKFFGIVIDVADNAGESCCNFLTTGFHLNRNMKVEGENIVDLIKKEEKRQQEKEEQQKIEQREKEEQENNLHLQLSRILFEMPIEIEGHELSWFSPEDCRYYCQITNDHYFCIWDRFPQWTVMKNREIMGKFADILEALDYCKNYVYEYCQETKFMWDSKLRTSMANKAPTKKMKEYVKKIAPNINVEKISRDVASNIISSHKAKKKSTGPTQKMAYFLKMNGFEDEEIGGMTRSEAGKIIGRIKSTLKG